MEKDDLRREFSRDYKKHYSVELFNREGFQRRKCKKCGSYFWSIAESDTCGDSECEPYSFLMENWREGDYIGMWKRFANYFEKNGHVVINRYPVIARWRPDLYFTIASIVDFMRLEQGKVVWEYTANPLVVPQMCLRFPDIPNVGITGRHHTSFIMAGQHSFLDGSKGAYWKDRCIDLNFGFLTEVLKIPKEKLKYKEDVWAMPDLSSFGPCIETFVDGVELVNSVFTEYAKVGNSIQEINMKVIDVGWGFERLVWYDSHAPTSYDANLGYAVEWMLKKAGIKYDKNIHMKYYALAGKLDVDQHTDIAKIRKNISEQLGVSEEELDKKLGPIEGIYAIADHTKTLVFALADGGIPSNVGGGYNLRVVLRRAQSFIEKYGLPFGLEDVALKHIEYLNPMFPEIVDVKESLHDIIDTEVSKYRSTVERAEKRVVEISKRGGFTYEMLASEYESNGVTPEIIREVSRKSGIKIDVPEDFYSKLTEKHIFQKTSEEEMLFNPEGYERTDILYYEDVLECNATVIGIQKNALVLDRTCFYPESGGQVYDTGTIDGVEVEGVYKYSGVIFHKVKNPQKFSKGMRVKCIVNRERREALKRHHTATHILGGVCRKVLGRHVWQAGAHKDIDKATLDITHYKNISREEIALIEKIVNEIILNGVDVEIKEYDRKDAESKYGFVLYQGGGSPGKKIRVVNVKGVDVEACGGLHVKNTREIGMFKVMKTERIQDGVVRITYCAGRAAIDYVQKIENVLYEASSVYSVSYFDLPRTTKKFFDEWKERGKEIERCDEVIAKIEAGRISGFAEIDYDKRIMVKIGEEIIKRNGWAVMINKEGIIVSVAGPSSGKNAREEMERVFKRYGGGKGGGNERIAMGRVSSSA
ncbi:MAG: alanine--tRNA ligase [Candidatus Micrarchaeia archaeon]